MRVALASALAADCRLLVTFACPILFGVARIDACLIAVCESAQVFSDPAEMPALKSSAATAEELAGAMLGAGLSIHPSNMNMMPKLSDNLSVCQRQLCKAASGPQAAKLFVLKENLTALLAGAAGFKRAQLFTALREVGKVKNLKVSSLTPFAKTQLPCLPKSHQRKPYILAAQIKVPTQAPGNVCSHLKMHSKVLDEFRGQHGSSHRC